MAEVVAVTAPVRQPDFVGCSLNLLMQLWFTARLASWSALKKTL